MRSSPSSRPRALPVVSAALLLVAILQGGCASAPPPRVIIIERAPPVIERAPPVIERPPPVIERPATPLPAPAPSPAAPAFSPPAPLPPPVIESPRAPGISDAVPRLTAPPDATVPPNAVTNIVAVLPLEAGPYARVAEAVRAGFSTAAELASTPVTIIPYAEGDVATAVDKARRGGASVLVGPLLRDDLKALALVDGPLPWTIALNQPEDGTPLPARVYTLTLSIDGEARQIAHALRVDGVERVAIVGSDAPLQQRFAGRFTDAWILEGGGPPGVFRILRDPEALGLLRRELQRARPDAIILAADAADAALVKPYLPVQRVYASSQVNERQPPEVLQDLNGVRFIDVPLLADPNAPNVAGIAERASDNPTLARLFALGFDAFQVAATFEHGPPQGLDIDGASGRLTLGHQHNIVREGRWMRFEGGHAVPDDRP